MNKAALDFGDERFAHMVYVGKNTTKADAIAEIDRLAATNAELLEALLDLAFAVDPDDEPDSEHLEHYFRAPLLRARAAIAKAEGR